MGPARRGPVGVAAESLKATLVSKLAAAKANKSPPGITDGLVRAINLCERFLNSCTESEAALDVLKDEVRKALINLGKPPQPSGTRRQLSAPGPSGSPHLSHNTTRSTTPQATSSKRSDEIDWSLPPLILDQKAHLKQNGYTKLIAQAEAAQKADDEARAAHKRNLQLRTRQTYGDQVAEIEAKREAERQRKADEARQMSAAMAQYEADEMQRYLDNQNKQLATQRMYKGQVDELNELRRQEEERHQREITLTRRQLQEEERQDRMAKAQKARENREMLERIKRENAAKLAQKALAAQQQQEEEKRYNAEYIKVMDEKEAKRLAALEAIAEKQRRAFERGGGVALQLGLEEQARLDEERMIRVQAEYEAKMSELERQRVMRQQEATQLTLKVLNEQKERKASELRAQREAEARLRAAAEADVLAMKAEQKAKKQADRQTKASVFQEQKNAMLAEHQRRFEHINDPMDPRDEWIHKKVLQGQERGFTTLDNSKFSY